MPNLKRLPLMIIIIFLGLSGLMASTAAARPDSSHPCGTLADPTSLTGLVAEQGQFADQYWACGYHNVPVDAAHPGRTIPIRYAYWHRPGPPRNTFVALAGGPGQGAFPFSQTFKTVLDPVLKGQDLLVFDQRGTGGSRFLKDSCVDGATSYHIVKTCSSLVKDWKFYGTANSADDIEALRTHFQIPQINLLGVSYGTKVEETYARKYPDHLGKMIMDSVVPPNGIYPFWQDSLAAVPRILDNLCKNNNCPFTTDIKADFAQFLQMTKRGYLTGKAYQDKHHLVRLYATQELLLNIILGADFSPYNRLALPGLIHAAVSGNPRPFLDMFGVTKAVLKKNEEAGRAVHPKGIEPAYPEISGLLYVLTTCEDASLPWDTTASFDQRKQLAENALLANTGSFSSWSTDAVRSLSVYKTCANLDGSGGSPAALGAFPQTPVLVINGADDMRTPIESGRAMANSFPNAQAITIPRQGHSVLTGTSECAKQAVVDFMADKTVQACPTVKPTRNLQYPVNRYAQFTPEINMISRPLGAVMATYNQLAQDVLNNSATTIPTGKLTEKQRRIYYAGMQSGYAELFSYKKAFALRLTHYAFMRGVYLDGFIYVPLRGGAATFSLKSSGSVTGTISNRRDPRTLDANIDGERTQMKMTSLYKEYNRAYTDYVPLAMQQLITKPPVLR